MKVRIYPSRVSGAVKAPPSKSLAHRAVISAALASGRSVIRGISKSEDILATLDCVSALGARYTLDGDVLTVYGVGGLINENESARENECAVLPCRESGSTLRFLIPVSLVLRQNAVFTGEPRLMERGIGVYSELFSKKGIKCSCDGEKITLSGRFTPGEYVLPGNVSSQFVSGLMLMLPLLRGDSVIKVLPPVESRGYIDITLSVLKDFGIDIEEKERNVFYVRGGQEYSARDTEIEGDWSNGAALLALSELTANENAELSGAEEHGTLNGYAEKCGLRSDSVQGDRVCLDLIKMLRKPGARADISGCPDLGPVLFAIAAARNGGEFIGTRRLRIKESDRASVSAEELKKFGISVTVDENSVTVHKGTLKTPCVTCQGHNDHRIVMALTVLGALVGCEIEGAEAINKSYPDFFEAVSSLGIKVEKENDA